MNSFILIKCTRIKQKYLSTEEKLTFDLIPHKSTLQSSMTSRDLPLRARDAKPWLLQIGSSIVCF